MNLEITEGSILLLKEGKLDITDLFILQAIQEGEINLLEVLDSGMKDLEIYLKYQRMCRMGLLKFSNSENPEYFELDEKGNQLLETIKNQ